MSTKMNEANWGLAQEVFRACLPAWGATDWVSRVFIWAVCDCITTRVVVERGSALCTGLKIYRRN